ncbi:uncharacterized protein LOC127749795 isoform X1 [Frankliniella occidentalis]|uniref:Uncharacterized protein LOC127749795 isoform X1 n=2 Tax=Frankliniella occidentalis TaxID=133901 RepID=A0A9C6WZ75_FRAOC|nr:uncharacterized protein LOC127749795 isoform X1 [Frankliniella occidentalis]
MGGNKKKKSTCYVYVKNLTNNKKYALSADLLYHWNGNANEAQEKFDPSKPFHSSNQYCVFYAGKAVRHAAYHVAETRELCLSKTKEVGGMSLRPSVVPARKSLTPAEVSNTVTLSQMEMADAKAMEESAESKRKEVHGDRKKVKNEMNNNKSNKENPIKKKKSKLNKTSPVNDINQDTLPSDETEAHREKHYEMGHAKIVCESLKEKGTVGESPRKQSFVRALSPPSQVRSPMKAAEQPPWIDPQTQHLPLHENLMKQFENNDQRTPDKGLDDTDFSSDFSDREKKKPNRKENLKRRSSASEVSNVSLLKEDQTPVLVGPNKSALGSGSKRPSCNDVNSGPTKKVKDDGAVCNSTFNTMTTAITKNSDCSCGSNYIDLCKRLETVEVALNLVSTSNKKLFDLVSKMYNTGKKCRISQLERAVEGYDDIPVPDDCVLVGELNGSMQFLSKEDIVTMEKKKTSLKGRILELGRLFYGDNYYLYSLVGIKNKIEKTYEFKMETPHITAIAKILQCLRWTKSEDLSSSNIGRMMGKYFSEARKVVEKAEEERQMKAFHASQQAKSVDPKKNSDDSDSSNQNE